MLSNPLLVAGPPEPSRVSLFCRPSMLRFCPNVVEAIGFIVVAVSVPNPCPPGQGKATEHMSVCSVTRPIGSRSICCP